MKLVDKLKKNFARNLQALRTREKLTQAGLADKLNQRYRDFDFELQRTSIVNYEAENAMPRIDALYCMADYFGKTVDQLISPNMDAATLVHKWLNPGEAGITYRAMPEGRVLKGEEPAGDIPDNFEATLNQIMTRYVDAMAYRQFYMEFAKRFLLELLKSAQTLEDREKINTLFDKTFLGCWISKSKQVQDLAANMLDPTELQVFLAFQENSSIEVLAKGLEMEEQQVVEIFSRAQEKINNYFDAQTKS